MENFGYPLEELAAIVAELTPKYVGYEHSSITYEKAQMLMEGVLYCIQECMGQDSHALAEDKLPAQKAYTLGQKIVSDKFQKLQLIYNKLIFDFKDYGLDCLKDTVAKGMPAFIENYDLKFTPQETLLTLDYPLLKKSVTSTGIDAVLEYLECIDLEQQFLQKFDDSYIREILCAYHTDYELLLENICHIVLQNIIGHLIVDKPLTCKGFSPDDFAYIENIFYQKSVAEIERFITKLVRLLTERYYDNDAALSNYLRCDIPDIAARIQLGMREHLWEGIFLV